MGAKGGCKKGEIKLKSGKEREEDFMGHKVGKPRSHGGKIRLITDEAGGRA